MKHSPQDFSELKLGRVSEDMFGSVYTTFTTLDNFLFEGQAYQIGGIRWPGGSLAEGKISGGATYDLTASDVYVDVGMLNSDKGLENMLKTAYSLDQPFSMVIPTLPIFEDGSQVGTTKRERLLEQYIEDFELFYKRLTTSDSFYDSALSFQHNGPSITLEIGNETAHLGWSNGKYDSTWNYAKIAAPILNSAAESSSNNVGVNLEIAVQMGVNVGGARNIISALVDLQEDYDHNLLDQIDSIVSHNMLVFAAEDFSITREQEIIGIWEDALIDNASDISDIGDIDLYASAWAVGDHRFGHEVFEDLDSFNLIKQADFLRDSEFKQYIRFLKDLDGNDTGARQGAGTADVFAKLIALDYDAAAIWGTVDPNSHTNSYQSFWGTHRWANSTEAKSVPLSHGGEVMAMLADNLLGYSLEAGGSVKLDSDGEVNWHASYFDWSSGKGVGEVNTFHFSDQSDAVLLSSVTDIDGDRATFDGSLMHAFALPEGTDRVEVQAVGTEFLFEAWRTFRDNSDNDWFFDQISNVELREFRRLFEVPTTQSYEIDVSGKDRFQYEFTSDFETVIFSFIDDKEDNSPNQFTGLGNESDSIKVHCWGYPDSSARQKANKLAVQQDKSSDEFQFGSFDSEKAERPSFQFVAISEGIFDTNSLSELTENRERIDGLVEWDALSAHGNILQIDNFIV